MGLGSGIREPGSGKNLFRIPDPGVKKALDPGSGSATLPLTISCCVVQDKGLTDVVLTIPCYLCVVQDKGLTDVVLTIPC